MPTRHLSDEQRQRYASFAADPSANELAQYFHLDRSDREILDGLRGDHNRLGLPQYSTTPWQTMPRCSEPFLFT
jgi:hypothetical protein